MRLNNYMDIANEGLTFSKVGKTKVVEFNDKDQNPIYLSIKLLGKLNTGNKVLAALFGTGANENTDGLLKLCNEELNRLKETMKVIETNFKKQGNERVVKYKELPGLLNNNPDWSSKYKEAKEILSKAITHSKKFKDSKISSIISEVDKIIERVNSLLKSNISIVNK